MTGRQRKLPASKNEEIIIPLLARRSCHLPGNDWKADWVQFMRNNHILFGICLHHPLHPLEWWERIIALIGSISFGLIMTNLSYIFDGFDEQEMSESLIHISDQLVITKGMVMLWTVGGAVHSCFDVLVWNVMACACCHPGGRWGASSRARYFKDCGSYILIPFILCLVCVATYVVLKRAAESDGSGNSDNDEEENLSLLWKDVDGFKSFSFLSKYCIELTLAWLLYFPTLGTIVFSGVLGCDGRVPGLGGRPRDKKMVEEEFTHTSSAQPYARWT